MNLVFRVRPAQLRNVDELRQALLKESWVEYCVRKGFVDPRGANKYLELKTQNGVICSIYRDNTTWLIKDADANTKNLLMEFFSKYGYII